MTNSVHFIKKDLETDLMNEINVCLKKFKYSDIPNDRKYQYDKIVSQLDDFLNTPNSDNITLNAKRILELYVYKKPGGKFRIQSNLKKIFHKFMGMKWDKRYFVIQADGIKLLKSINL